MSGDKCRDAIFIDSFPTIMSLFRKQTVLLHFMIIVCAVLPHLLPYVSACSGIKSINITTLIICMDLSLLELITCYACTYCMGTKIP